MLTYAVFFDLFSAQQLALLPPCRCFWRTSCGVSRTRTTTFCQLNWFQCLGHKIDGKVSQSFRYRCSSLLQTPPPAFFSWEFEAMLVSLLERPEMAYPSELLLCSPPSFQSYRQTRQGRLSGIGTEVSAVCSFAFEKGNGTKFLIWGYSPRRVHASLFAPLVRKFCCYASASNAVWLDSRETSVKLQSRTKGFYTKRSSCWRPSLWNVVGLP